MSLLIAATILCLAVSIASGISQPSYGNLSTSKASISTDSESYILGTSVTILINLTDGEANTTGRPTAGW